MRNLRWKIAVGLIAGVIAWWQGEMSPGTLKTEVSTASKQATNAAGTSGLDDATRARVPAVAIPNRTQGAEASSQQVLSASARESLAEFQRVQRIVLAASEEEGARQRSLKDRLFRDRGLMREFELLLKAPAMGNQEHASLQLAALDVLFDALQSKSTDLAERIVSSIVEDRTIEDEKLDLRRRQALAEVKAEVLFRWSAAAPDRTEQIVGLLPGPVSKKIWGNVLEAQAQNAAESQLEAMSRARTRSTAH